MSKKLDTSSEEYRLLQQDIYDNRLKINNRRVKRLGKYINSYTKIEHECEVCGHGSKGEWLTRPQNLSEGYGCPRCRNIAFSKGGDKYCEELKETHNGTIILVGEFINTKTKTLHKCLVCEQLRA